MPVTASRTVQISFSGDITENIIQSAADNLTAFGKVDYVTLSVTNNTISPPVVSGFTVVGLEIQPPAGNTTVITLKGVAADSGVPLHLTDPCSLSLGTGFSSLVLSVGTQINGVRLVWT